MATFARFPHLPPELRIRIWGEAAKIPPDEHIVAEFYAVPFYPAKMKQGGRIQYYFTMRLGGNSKALGTLSASHESREVTLWYNPNMIQFNNGQKIYFNGDRNVIHFDLASMYFIRNYILRDCRKFWRDRHSVPWARADPVLVCRRARKFKGFDDIKTLSFPPLMCEVTAVIFHTLFSVWTPFTQLQRIVPKTMPNTMRCVTAWGDFMQRQARELYWANSLERWQYLALKRILDLSPEQLAEVWSLMVSLFLYYTNSWFPPWELCYAFIWRGS